MIFKIISVLATVFTCIIFLSPYSLYSNLTSGTHAEMPSILPLCSVLVQSLFWFTYGAYILDFVVLAVNIFGIACGVLYTYFCLRSKPKTMFYVKLLGSLLVYVGVVGFIFYSYDDYEDKRRFLGYASMSSSIILFASPLATIFEVIKNKDSSSIPLGMTFANFAATTSWVIYGVLASDFNIVLPNTLGLLLSLITLYIRKKYKSSGPIFAF